MYQKPCYLIEEKTLRIFAGPNGSGKSTVIRAIVEEENLQNPNFHLGYYINADDIAVLLKNSGFSFSQRGLKNVSKKLILDFAEGSGLLHQEFSLIKLEQSFEVKDNYIKLLHGGHAERLAQVIARFLRQEMIEKGFSHTYETVFSHPSTIDDIKKARTAGFKVVLYFVATESPEINKERVKLRVKEKGHAVPEALIESRYYRSLDLVFDASQECDEVWFLDNSRFQNPFTKVARFKKVNGIKVWDKIEKNNISTWFIKYYYHKIQQTINRE